MLKSSSIQSYVNSLINQSINQSINTSNKQTNKQTRKQTIHPSIHPSFVIFISFHTTYILRLPHNVTTVLPTLSHATLLLHCSRTMKTRDSMN